MIANKGFTGGLTNKHMSVNMNNFTKILKFWLFNFMLINTLSNAQRSSIVFHLISIRYQKQGVNPKFASLSSNCTWFTE